MSQREKSVQMPAREGMNCGLKPPAVGSQGQRVLETSAAMLWHLAQGRCEL